VRIDGGSSTGATAVAGFARQDMVGGILRTAAQHCGQAGQKEWEKKDATLVTFHSQEFPLFHVFIIGQAGK
jgi:hypothetical protein